MYVVRCFCSRAWSLREAAVEKMALELPRRVAGGRPGRLEAFQLACSLVGDIAARDRIAHVFVAGVAKLLPAALAVAVGDPSSTVRRSERASARARPRPPQRPRSP